MPYETLAKRVGNCGEMWKHLKWLKRPGNKAIRRMDRALIAHGYRLESGR